MNASPPPIAPVGSLDEALTGYRVACLRRILNHVSASGVEDEEALEEAWELVEELAAMFPNEWPDEIMSAD